MKPVLQAILMLGLIMPAFSAAPSVDFDGKTKTNKDVTTFLRAETPNFSMVPVKTSDDSQLVKRPGIVDENGVFTALTPVKTWRGDDGIIRTQYTHWPTQKISWSLQCKGTSQPTWSAKQTYTFTSDQAAGHLHYDPVAPSLKVGNVVDSNSTVPPDDEFYPRPSPFYFPSMSTNVMRYYWEWMPKFATTLVEEFQSFGACTGTQIDMIDVKVPYLSEMPADPSSYILNKTETTKKYHPKCHNGTKALTDTLKTIATQYKAEFPTAGVIVINHMSLPWGGKFDLNNGWGVDPAEDHQGHQYGIEADISKANVPLQNRKKLIEIMCKNTERVYSEVPLCYHIRAKTAKPYPDDFDIAKSTITVCCKNGVINPDNMNTCVQD